MRTTLVLSVALAAVSAAACSSASPECSASETTGGYTSCDGAITILEPGEREPVPDIGGETLDGDEVALSDYDGDLLVLNTWASWCAPCRAEAPDLKEVSEQLADEGVQFVGINIRDNRTNAERFEQQQRIPYPSIVDPDSSLLLELPAELYPAATPTTYVVDEQGRVAARILNATTASTLAGVIEDVRG